MTKIVSERLNSRANVSICPGASPSAPSTTANGFPANGRSVNTSQIW